MKRHLILALVLCGALGVAYFATRENNVRVGIRELKLPVIERQSISKIEYTGKEHFALKKQGDRFIVEFNDKGTIRSVPASKEVIDELFVALSEVKGGSYVAERIAKHEDFKVSEAAGQRVTLFAGDKVSWSLIIGDYADEGGRFVRLPEDDSVFLVKARFWDITRSGPMDFRERNIVDVSESDVQSVRLESHETHQLGFMRDEKMGFIFDAVMRSKYPQFHVSSAKAAEYVKSIAKLRASAFIEDADAIAKAKLLLDKSSERIVIVPKSNRAEIVVKVAVDAKEKRGYAQVVGTSAIFEISDYAYERLHTKPEEFAESSTVEKENPMKALPPEMQKQIQEAIRKQQQGRT